MEYNMKARYIDKELILSRVSEEEIFEYYLNVPVDLVDGNSRLFTSPIRNDRHPTCKFFIATNGSVYFHDFSGYFSGDCFSLVQHLFNVDYGTALNYIARDLGIVDDKNIVNSDRKERLFTERNAQPRAYSKIGINRRGWNVDDQAYWQAYHISHKTLEKFHVFPVKKVYLNNKQNYLYTRDDPAYAYFFFDQKFKIYFPQRKMFRFLCNTDRLQGYHQLPAYGELLIITKALKDVMVLWELGYLAVAPQGETAIIAPQVIEELKERFKYIVVFFDNDEAGHKGAEKLVIQVDEAIFIPEHLGIKDISDFSKEKGVEEAKRLLFELLER